MNSETTPAVLAAEQQSSPDYAKAGASLDPWEQCALLEYGADRSYAWAVRTQVIATPPEGRARIEDRLIRFAAQAGDRSAGRRGTTAGHQ
jgi:hypothetical protein